MTINYNDTLQKRMLNWIYYGENMNPFYSCVISYLIEIGGYKLSKDGSEYEQIKKLENILKTNSKIFKEILKTLTQNGFLEDLSFRYEYSNKFYKNRGGENYFSILGKDIDERIVNSFDTTEDKMICRSLISWINDGSHSIPDDLYIDSYTDSIDRYKEIFKEIFIKMDHKAHYDMMMS